MSEKESSSSSSSDESGSDSSSSSSSDGEISANSKRVNDDGNHAEKQNGSKESKKSSSKEKDSSSSSSESSSSTNSSESEDENEISKKASVKRKVDDETAQTKKPRMEEQNLKTLVEEETENIGPLPLPEQAVGATIEEKNLKDQESGKNLQANEEKQESQSKIQRSRSRSPIKKADNRGEGNHLYDKDRERDSKRNERSSGKSKRETSNRSYADEKSRSSNKSSRRRSRSPRPREVDFRKPKSTRRENDSARDKEDEKRKDRDESKEEKKEEGGSGKITERQRRTVDLLTSRTGGAYIPPAKLRLLQAEITDKSSAAYQRIAWEALKKSIHGYINKVNVDNIGIITRELLKENIIRGRGLLCRSIIQAQAASPTFTHVYAALVAIINSKFPNIGELLLKRLVIQFKRGFRRNDKSVCISASRFIAHLVNQRVAHEILALEILTLLVETPTDDSVEVAIAFLKECGMKLTEVSSKGVNAIFEMLKNILHEGKLDKRVQYMIEVVFQVRKDGFKDHQSVIEALELVEEDDQFTHLIMLDEATDAQDALNVFKFDDKYEANEDKYKGLSKELLGSDASDSEGNSSDSGSEGSDEEDEEEGKEKADVIIDNTETNLVALRRTIYLTIHSSLDYEECAHKLMKMELKPGQEMELCHMFLDCCAEQRTYEKFYGLLAQRFCMINKIYVPPFEEIFRDTYHTTHRLDTNRLRNVSKFFAHLLFTDAIGWDVLECIKLNEEDTTSSSRIFIKILFQELAEYMGLSKLNERLKDGTLSESFNGLFPRDNPRNTRFAINFFTSIGLGGLTDELREFLKSAPKSVPAINQEILGVPKASSSSSSSSTSSSSSSSSSSSTSTSDSDSSSSEDSNVRKKKKKMRTKKTMEQSGKKKKNVSSSSSSSSSDSDSSDEDKDKKKKKAPKNDKNKNKSKKDKEEFLDKKRVSQIGKKNDNRREKSTERDRQDRAKNTERSRDKSEKTEKSDRNKRPSPEFERNRERNGKDRNGDRESNMRMDRNKEPERNGRDRQRERDRERDFVQNKERERGQEKGRDGLQDKERDRVSDRDRTSDRDRPSDRERPSDRDRLTDRDRERYREKDSYRGRNREQLRLSGDDDRYQRKREEYRDDSRWKDYDRQRNDSKNNIRDRDRDKPRSKNSSRGVSKELA